MQGWPAQGHGGRQRCYPKDEGKLLRMIFVIQGDFLKPDEFCFWIAQIFSSQVSNKILRISASFELWYMIVAHLVLELLKNKIRPVSKNHPVDQMQVVRRKCSWAGSYHGHGLSAGISQEWMT